MISDRLSPPVSISTILLTLTVSLQAALPPAAHVEAQPLISQVKRLQEALGYLGAPLPAETRAALAEAARETGDDRVASLVQAALDPHCIAAVNISRDGQLAAIPSGDAADLQEQGWRTQLVKVVNHAEAATTLRVSSLNAGPLPNAPADQVELRWFDLQMYNSRPMKPKLSGLPLEYRIIQLYSKDTGRKTAQIAFNLGQPNLPAGESISEETRRTGAIKEWDFADGMQGWFVQNHMQVEAKDGVLKGRTTGNDPSMSARLRAPGGHMVARFSVKAEKGSFGQVFWWTTDKPRPDGERRVNFMLERNGGQWKEYAIPFDVQGEMRGLRLDLGGGPSEIEVDWVQLSYADAPGRQWASVDLAFNALPSRKVTLNVRDENGKPCTAAFVIEDRAGRIYPAQTKRLAPDFFFHPQIYRGDGASLRLPDGDYTIRCSRGPESIPETKKLTVAGNAAVIDYQVKRWVDPAKRGWYSGDHHIHAAGCRHYANPTEGVLAEDMARHIQGEDLKIGANLTWGPGFDYQKQFFTGKLDKASKYPYLLRYDIEVSGFGSHRSGHLCLLRLTHQIYPGGESKDHWPTLGLNTLKWAKKQGAITGPAHSAIGLSPTAKRIKGPDGPNNLPNYAIPRYDGIGANEYIVDITHSVPGPDGKLVPAVDFISTMDTHRGMEWNMWYHTLNCGFRVRASGETDFPCISGDRVGKGRVYAKVDGRLDYDQWCEEIKNGRSYVSDGFSHLMAFKATAGGTSISVGEKGGELPADNPTAVNFSAIAAARFEDGRKEALVELVVNGYPVASKTIPANGTEQELNFRADIERSSWVALRINPSSHTNPIFVTIDGQPIQSRRSAQWFLAGVDQLWSQKERTYDADEMDEARAAYEHAKRIFRKLATDAKYD